METERLKNETQNTLKIDDDNEEEDEVNGPTVNIKTTSQSNNSNLVGGS